MQPKCRHLIRKSKRSRPNADTGKSTEGEIQYSQMSEVVRGYFAVPCSLMLLSAHTIECNEFPFTSSPTIALE
jgi:hypothetical protein